MEQEKPMSKSLAPEREWTGPIWKHPYMIYVWLTLVLFAFLLLMAWLAWTNDWIPHR
jgi:hypothetical protein